jgi:hypothetical protein
MGQTILVYDERFEAGPKFVSMFDKVPEEWTTEEMMKRYGIGKHLCVYAERFVPQNCVHHGTRFRNYY